jgi:hypothetical protein
MRRTVLRLIAVVVTTGALAAGVAAMASVRSAAPSSTTVVALNPQPEPPG